MEEVQRRSNPGFKDAFKMGPGSHEDDSSGIDELCLQQKGEHQGYDLEPTFSSQSCPFQEGLQNLSGSSTKRPPSSSHPFPTCGVLSLDTSGPFHQAPDIIGKAKYMLVGTLTWCVPKSSPIEEPEDEQEDLPDDAPILESGEVEEDEEVEKEGEGEREGEVNPMVAPGNAEEATWDGHEGIQNFPGRTKMEVKEILKFESFGWHCR